MGLCRSFGIEPLSVAVAAAAAILYDNPEDPASVEVQALLRDGGVDAVLERICGLDTGSEEANMIRNAVQQLSGDIKGS